jgi:hypothetical protein
MDRSISGAADLLLALSDRIRVSCWVFVKELLSQEEPSCKRESEACLSFFPFIREGASTISVALGPGVNLLDYEGLSVHCKASGRCEIRLSIVEAYVMQVTQITASQLRD